MPLESRAKGRPNYKPSRYMSDLPANTTHLSLDQTTGELTAYDITHRVLGKIHHSHHNSSKVDSRQSTYGACTAMVSGDIKKLHGAFIHCAEHVRNGIIQQRRDPGYPQYPASVCTDFSTVAVTANDQPTCSVQQESTGGVLVGTSLPVTLTSTQGTSYSTTSTVTQSASLAVGDTFGAKMTVPGVEVSDSITVTATFTNTLSTSYALSLEFITLSHVTTTPRSTQSAVNQQQTEGVTMSAPAGQSCSLSFTTKSCTTTGTGSSPDRLSIVHTNGHYLWALNMDYFLSLDQRSSFINFKAAISSSTLSSYSGHCA
ncbi:hypothetical protein B0H10DRAFT_2428984 [Mycena sp. CBHHK59/15]|nr:hypothetical protein B0H10DRAFT_2428984 [Mycena sp. CBHHK59/15]